MPVVLTIHVLSFGLRLLALGFCVGLWRRTRDARLGLLAVFLAAAASIEGRIVFAGGVQAAVAFSGERIGVATLAVSVLLVSLVWTLRSMVGSERAERELLAATLSGLREGIIWLDAEDRVQDVNARAAALLGVSREAVVGAPIRTVLVIETPPDVTQLPLELDQHLFDVVEPGRSMQVLLQGADHVLHVELSLSDHSQGRVLVLHDRTEIREVEREVYRTQKIESVGVLAGGIAHDFNNLLTAVSGHASLLASGTTSPERTQLLGRRIEQAAKRGQQLSRQLLTFSRGGAPVPEDASLSDLVDETARFVMHGAEPALTLDVAPKLWARIDAGQIAQVVQNLVLNARQATGPGGRVSVTLRSGVRVEELGAGLFHELVIDDDGPGVPPEVRDRIFEPFFTTRDEGSGLGLSVSWAIVRQHRGRMTLEDAPSGGARFRVCLPAMEAAEPKRRRIPDPLRGAHVLLMDDEDAVREVGTELLKHLGYRVTAVANGDEAVALWSTERFDLAVLDLTIPGGMGGLDTLRALIALDPAVRAICSTGYAESHHEQWLAEGFSGVLPKPYGLRDLKRVLAEVLGDSTSQVGSVASLR